MKRSRRAATRAETQARGTTRVQAPAVAGREALGGNPDWSFIGIRLLALLILAVACTLLSTLTFRAYQRSV